MLRQASQLRREEKRSVSAARVLVVDDDEGIRRLVRDLLRDEGYEVAAAPSGAAALAQVGPPRRWRPDLILLDAYLPGMDGPAFARAYRQTPGPHAPVVLLTGTGGVDAAQHAEAVGAAGFLRKPFNLDALLALVRQHTEPIAGRGAGAAATE
jgi:CheY-like chemotaxis protein